MKIEEPIKDKVAGCPFGHKCDACNLYKPVYRRGRDGKFTQILDCTYNHLLTMMSEMKENLTGVQAAVESRGNATNNHLNEFVSLAKQAQKAKRLNNV